MQACTNHSRLEIPTPCLVSDNHDVPLTESESLAGIERMQGCQSFVRPSCFRGKSTDVCKMIRTLVSASICADSGSSIFSVTAVRSSRILMNVGCRNASASSLSCGWLCVPCRCSSCWLRLSCAVTCKLVTSCSIGRHLKTQRSNLCRAYDSHLISTEWVEQMRQDFILQSFLQEQKSTPNALCKITSR